MTTPPSDDERFEHIPWDQIAQSGNRNLYLYSLAGAILIAALVAAVVRNGSTDAQLSATPTAATVEPLPAPTVSSTTATPGTPNTSAPVVAGEQTPQSWSEADLLAFPAESLAAEAGAIAEWVASDFFTVDGGEEITEDLAAMLPEGSVLPKAADGARSFVEWARAVSVVESSPGVYQVLVAVRRLGAADGESYRRMEPIGVVVSLAWTRQGWSVTDLPALAETPQPVQAPAWSQTDIPSHIADAIAASTGGEVEAGVEVGESWRLVVRLTDQIGNSWPLVVWSDEAGNPIPPPGPQVQG